MANADRVGVGGRGEDPGGPLEHVGVGAFDALLFGAGHRVAADEAGVVQLGHDRALDAGHVGDDSRRLEGLGGHLGDGAGRGGDEGDQGARVGPDLVDGAELQGPGLARQGRGRDPVTRQPRRRRPRPIEPPMRPVPTIWARGRPRVRGSRRADQRRTVPKD